MLHDVKFIIIIYLQDQHQTDQHYNTLYVYHLIVELTNTHIYRLGLIYSGNQVGVYAKKGPKIIVARSVKTD